MDVKLCSMAYVDDYRRPLCRPNAWVSDVKVGNICSPQSLCRRKPYVDVSIKTAIDTDFIFDVKMS